MNAEEIAYFQRLLKIHRAASRNVPFGSKDEADLLQQILAVADEVGLHHEFDDAKLNVKFDLKSALSDDDNDAEKRGVVIATTLANCVLALTAFVKASLDFQKLQRVTLVIFRSEYGIDASLGNRVVSPNVVVSGGAQLQAPIANVIERGGAGFLKPKEITVVLELLEDAIVLETVGPETSPIKIIGGTFQRKAFQIAISHVDTNLINNSALYFAQSFVLNGIDSFRRSERRVTISCPRVDRLDRSLVVTVVADSDDDDAIASFEQQLATIVAGAKDGRSVNIQCNVVFAAPKVVADVNWRVTIGQRVPGIVAQTAAPSNRDSAKTGRITAMQPSFDLTQTMKLERPRVVSATAMGAFAALGVRVTGLLLAVPRRDDDALVLLHELASTLLGIIARPLSSGVRNIKSSTKGAK